MVEVGEELANRAQRGTSTHGQRARSSLIRRWWAGFVEQVRADLSHRRLFIALPFLTIFGLCAYAGLGVEPSLAVILALLAVCSGLTISVRHREITQNLCALTTAFLLGFAILPLHGVFFGTQMLDWPLFGAYQMRINEVLGSGDDKRIIVQNIQPLNGAEQVPFRKARLFVRDAGDLRSGDLMHGKVRFAPVPGPVVPGAFDAQFHAYFDGIGAYGNSTGALSRVGERQVSTQQWIADLRQSIGMRIDRVLEGTTNGVARALTIGDQTRIDDDIRATIAAAGLAHILAISGLHLTLVAGGVYFGARLLIALSYAMGQRLPVKSMAAMLGILAALCYWAISGGSVSATRATLMLVLMFGAVLAGRQAITMRNVAIAAFFVILVDPASVFRASFQLSFAAVVALVGVYEGHKRRQTDQKPALWGIARFYAGVALTSLIAGLATAVFAAYHFQQTAPLGVLGNLLALPLVGFVVLPAAFVAIVLMPLGLDFLPLSVMGWGIDAILSIAGSVARLSDGLSPGVTLAPGALLLVLPAFFTFAVLRKSARYIGALISVPLLLVFGANTSPDMLIADTTQALAIRDGDTYGLMAGRNNSFAVRVWSSHYLIEIASKMNQSSCDASGCVYQSPKGYSMALVKRVDAFAEECSRADLVITRLSAPNYCAGPGQLIDRDDLRRGGVHRFDWNIQEQRFDIKPAIPAGLRPWRIARR